MNVVLYKGEYIDVDATLLAISKRKCELSLAEFIRQSWHVVEPGQPYVHGWHIDAICEHLEAITDGVEFEDGSLYNRLLINIPPGTMKSLTVGVFWPAWEWGPCNMPHMRYVCASHTQDLAVRDGLRMRRLIESEWYQARWGDRVSLTKDQNQKTKFENTATGFRQAAAAGSITGSRGDRVIIDDPHSVEGAGSDQMRATTLEWFLEAVPTRLNNPIESAIIVVMQRLHEEDVSGVILDKQLGYDHLVLPMRYANWRDGYATKIGFEDPRTEEGELLFPERFPLEVVEREERTMGPYATAGQFQQEPTPRGGGVIKRAWWKTWEHSDGIYPPMDYVIACLDTAYTTKTENDYSAMTVWGVFTGTSVETYNKYISRDGDLSDLDARSNMFDDAARVKYAGRNPQTVGARVMLMHAWAERLEINELIQKVAKTFSSLRINVDKLLIENKAAGHSVAQEIRRVYQHRNFMVQMYDPKGFDKLSRVYSIQHLFAEGLVYAPDRAWADKVIHECEIFPKGKHDDLVDTVSMALRHLRDIGLLMRGEEFAADLRDSMMHKGSPPPPLYSV
jgi:predicted phage terminase large subunit-like protein